LPQRGGTFFRLLDHITIGFTISDGPAETAIVKRRGPIVAGLAQSTMVLWIPEPLGIAPVRLDMVNDRSRLNAARLLALGAERMLAQEGSSAAFPAVGIAALPGVRAILSGR
jgi:hypothetical protein